MGITKNLLKKYTEKEITTTEIGYIESIIDSVDRIIQKHGYGLGECGYYFLEESKELIKDGMDEKRAEFLMDLAEEIAFDLIDF